MYKPKLTSITISHFFSIADLQMEVVLPYDMALNYCLPSFVPFQVDGIKSDNDIKVCVYAEAIEEKEIQGKLLSDISIVWGDRFRFYETEDHYITTVQSETDPKDLWVMYSSKDFKESSVYGVYDDVSPAGILNWLLMVVFGQASLVYDIILMHASVVENGKHGIAFLGKSGTGKSTHSQLWISHIPGYQLLNDDNPAIRVSEDGKIHVFGTPWSGKTPCYRNKVVELIGLVRLKQAQQNEWTKQQGKFALLNVLPSCTALRWNDALFKRMVDSLEKVINTIGVGHLACLPDAEAAKLCYNGIMDL